MQVGRRAPRILFAAEDRRVNPLLASVGLGRPAERLLPRRSWEDPSSEEFNDDSDEDSVVSEMVIDSSGEEIRRRPFEEGYLGDIDNASVSSWEEPGREGFAPLLWSTTEEEEVSSEEDGSGDDMEAIAGLSIQYALGKADEGYLGVIGREEATGPGSLLAKDIRLGGSTSPFDCRHAETDNRILAVALERLEYTVQVEVARRKRVVSWRKRKRRKRVATSVRLLCFALFGASQSASWAPTTYFLQTAR
ncbi:hypothetical protein FA13DRAFT_1834000 [Coprinellus micaceus]|uniref:Uncharacterized protein n=1 Tax=Coprinellus micaceus TaxID=71717 RepID=A0A4Y7TH95_COPMI|nr:hypothetical protein FA13DRAFT_1834000 [Coprinellus micaceus]